MPGRAPVNAVAHARVRARREEVTQRYLGGTTAYRLAKDYGVHPAWMSRQLDAWEVPKRPVSPRQWPHTPEQNRVTEERKRVTRRYRAGDTVYRLAKDYGVRWRWLDRTLRNWGEKPPSPGVPREARSRAQKQVIEDRAEITRRYRDGESAYRLAKDYGVAHDWLTRRLKSWQIPLRNLANAQALRTGRKP